MELDLNEGSGNANANSQGSDSEEQKDPMPPPSSGTNNAQQSSQKELKLFQLTIDQLLSHQFGGNKKVYDLIEQVLTSSHFLQQNGSLLLKTLGRDLIQKILGSVNLKNKPLNIKKHEKLGYLHFSGFPEQNLIRQMTLVLFLWQNWGQFPIRFELMTAFADDTNIEINRLSQFITPYVRAFFSVLSSPISPQSPKIKNALVELLTALNARGLMTIFGFRKTIGSQELAWPSLQTLMSGFTKQNQVVSLSEDEVKELKARSSNKQYHPPAKLTVGARALCKHANRSSEGFWGEPRGTEFAKNSHAEEICKRILKDACWINIHSLPKEEYVIEVRLGVAYGIRWTISGAFRGFLEPQMPDGHGKKWKH